ncbi:MAG: hypothetical protein CBC48_07205 [bacterium TMED88]|nr:MAG: hypothetical protein CBC48_07205 [bacterium TMED88]
MSFDKDYKLSYLKVIWQNKYVGIPVPTVGPRTTFFSAVQGDDLARNLAEAYIEVGNGGSIQLEGTDAERLALTPKLLNLYKSKSIIFNSIGIFRHMLVTLFLLSENHISPMASEPTDEDLDEEFLKKFQETQLDGINQLGNKLGSIMKRNVQEQKEITNEILRQNEFFKSDLIKAMKQMALAIEESHNMPIASKPIKKANSAKIECKAEIQKEDLHVGDTVEYNENGKKIVDRIKEKEGKVFILDNGKEVMPGSVHRKRVKRVGKGEETDSDEDEYSSDFETASNDIEQELLAFQAAGAQGENRCNQVEFLQTLNSQERDIILSSCARYLYLTFNLDNKQYAKNYQQFFKELNIRELPVAMQAFTEHLFENTHAIDIEDDYYMLIVDHPEHAWLSYLRLVTYEVFQLVGLFPDSFRQKCFEFLPFLIYDATVAFCLLNGKVEKLL